MVNKWVHVKDALPKSGQEVLTYYYDKDYEVEQFAILTYFRKGDTLNLEERKKMDLYGELHGKYDRPVEEDGFYIYDLDKDGLCKWRKHADIITHWQPLVAPKKK